MRISSLFIFETCQGVLLGEPFPHLLGMLVSVSEPATGTLFALALVLGALPLHIPPREMRKSPH